MEDYEIHETFSTGRVHRATDLINDRDVVLKDPPLNHALDLSKRELREASIMYELTHPIIVRLERVFYHDGSLWLVLESMDESLLFSIAWKDGKKCEKSTVKGFLRQILTGIAYCHRFGIIHRDLKPANLLLDDTGTVLKLADFGLARQYIDIDSEINLTPEVVTLEYRAPEILMGSDKYSDAVDMWSVGCIFAEIVTLKTFFNGLTADDMLDSIFGILGTPDELSWPGVSSLPRFPAGGFKHHPQLGFGGVSIVKLPAVALLSDRYIYTYAFHCSSSEFITDI